MPWRGSCLMPVDREHGYIHIRNFPIMVEEVMRLQEETGGQLFDESCFIEHHKKVACAQVIFALDTKYEQLRLMSGGVPPQRVDIGDPSWIYIPVDMFAGTSARILKTQDKPAGFVAWFRARRVYIVGNHRRRHPG